MQTLLLGEKEELDAEVKALYQRNGIAHILSISGLHITLLGDGGYTGCLRDWGYLVRAGSSGWCNDTASYIWCDGGHECIRQPCHRNVSVADVRDIRGQDLRHVDRAGAVGTIAGLAATGATF